MKKIPKEDYQKYSEIVLVSSRVWERAKNENNYEIFKDYLKQIIEYNKKFIKLRGYEGHPYNMLLDDYEPEMTVVELDEFFEKVRTELSPLIKRIVKSEKKVLEEEKRKNTICCCWKKLFR